MKYLISLMVVSCGLLRANEADLATDLAHLQQLMTALEAQLPATTPGLLSQIREGAHLHATPVKKELSPEQQAIVDRLASEYGKKSSYIIELVQELEAALAQGSKRPIAEINLQDPNLIKMVRRRLSVIAEEEEPAPAEAVAAAASETTTLNAKLISNLAQALVKAYKKEFPALTEEIAQQTATHLFTGGFVARWQNHNKAAEAEAERFIKQALGIAPADAQQPANGSFLGNLAGKLKSSLFGSAQEATPAAPEEEWNT